MNRLLIIIAILLTNMGVSVADQKAIFIPAGEFNMGCSVGDTLCASDEGPVGGIKVFVDAFWIDRHETSVKEYRACVTSGYCEEPFDNKRSQYCNYNAKGRDNYPVNCVNWNNAQSFCHWREGRLADEAEWEKAARAGTRSPYPWGWQAATCHQAVMDPGKPSESDDDTDGCWRNLSWPRGSHKPNSVGLYDMVGGMSEWVSNWYQSDAYVNIYGKGDLKGPEKGTKKAIKGGSWDEKYWAQRVSNRYAKPVTGNPDLYGSNGIRCAYSKSTSFIDSVGGLKRSDLN